MESDILKKARENITSSSYPQKKNQRILKHFKSQLKSTVKQEKVKQPLPFLTSDFNSVQRLQESMREQTIDLEIKAQQIKILEDDNKSLREELLALKKNHFKQYQNIQKNNNELLRSYETRFQMQLKAQEKQHQQEIIQHKEQLALLQKKKRTPNKKKKYEDNIIDTLLEEKFGLSKKYNELQIAMEKIQNKNILLEKKYSHNQKAFQSLQDRNEKKEGKNPFSNSFLKESQEIDQIVLDDLKEIEMESRDVNISPEIQKLKEIKGGTQEYEMKIEEISRRHQRNLQKRNKKYSNLIIGQLNKKHRKSTRNASFAEKKLKQKRQKSHKRVMSVNPSQKRPFKYLKKSKKKTEQKFETVQARKSVRVKRKGKTNTNLSNKSMVIQKKTVNDTKSAKKRKPVQIRKRRRVKRHSSSRLKCFKPHF